MTKTYEDLVKEAPDRIQEIAPEDLLQKLRHSEAVILLDVREGEEYARGTSRGRC